MSFPEYTRFQQLARTDAELFYLNDPISGVARVVDSSRDFGGQSFVDFSGDFGGKSGQYVEFNNFGHSTLGFYLNSNDTGRIEFQGSFDGVNFDPIILRELSSNGYTNHSYNPLPQNYIGSIAAIRKIRVIRTIDGSATGTVAGRMGKEVSTLEGIENNAPPHRFGNALFHKGFYLSGISTGNMLLHSPSDGDKFIITSISFGVNSTAGTNATFHETPDSGSNPDNWIYATYVKTNANDSISNNALITTPFVASGINNGLYLTSSDEGTIRGVIHGYSANE